MKIANNRFLCIYILALVLGLLPLYGCGGGGGGGSEGRRPSQSSGEALNSVTSKADENNAGTEISEAAENSPQPGSVTQSSNASNGVTTDRVSVRASYSGGQVQYRVRNISAGWSVDSTADTVLARHEGDDWDGVELMKRLSSGDLYVDVYSAREEKDYIAGGLWIYVPDSATEIDDLDLGVFGDGPDPFRQENFSGLSGTETYTGEVAVMYSEEGSIYYADGKVTLTVDFDRGTVRGRAHSFVDEDGYPAEPAVTLTLEETSIGTSNSGFFRGNTDIAELSGIGGEGKWGGQFFGNGNGIPRTAGGTFGVTTDGGEISALGVWGAGALALKPGTPPSEPVPPPSSGGSKCGTGTADGDSCTVGVSGYTITLNPDGSCQQGNSIISRGGNININGVNICKQAADSAGINWTPGSGFGGTATRHFWESTVSPDDDNIQIFSFNPFRRRIC